MKIKSAGLVSLSLLLASTFVMLTFQVVSAATWDQSRQSINSSAHLSYMAARRMSSLQQPPLALTATVQAQSGTTIIFKTHNGDPNNPDTKQFDIPHLMLHYEDGRLTPAISRTVILSVTGIEVPPPGVTVTLEVRTQNDDPDRGAAANTTIPVWFESQCVSPTTK